MLDDKIATWLLEEGNPSVNYWTLTRLLGWDEGDPKVRDTRKAIMKAGPAVDILAHYAGNGRWEEERCFYTLKYMSTHWQLLLLAELAADGRDDRIDQACRRMIDAVSNENDFIPLPCFVGNLTGYLASLGHGDDERVAGFYKQLARQATEGNWRCKYNWDLPCAWGAARALWGFGKLPRDNWEGYIQDAVESGIRFLGSGKLTEGKYPTNGPIHSLWQKVSFPLFYQADVLYILRVLADLDLVKTLPGLSDAIEWLLARRRPDGCWNGSSPYSSRMWTALEDNRRPSKWVTWQALYVIDKAGF